MAEGEPRQIVDPLRYLLNLSWVGGMVPPEYPCGDIQVSVFSQSSPEFVKRGYVNPQPGLNFVVEISQVDPSKPENRRLHEYFVIAKAENHDFI